MTKLEVAARLDWIKDNLAWLGGEGTYHKIELLISDVLRDNHDEPAPTGCTGCIHFDIDPYEFPCWSCARLKIDYYKDKKGDSNG